MNLLWCYGISKKIINNRVVIFMEDGTRVGNALKMCPSGRNEGPMLVVVDESSKSSSCDDGEKCKKQMGDHLVSNEEAIKITFKE